MRQSQTLAIKASEVRARLNELAGIETLDDAQRTELDTLTGEYRDVEARYRAALTAESGAAGHARDTRRRPGDPRGPRATGPGANRQVGDGGATRSVRGWHRGRNRGGVRLSGTDTPGAARRGARSRAPGHHPGAIGGYRGQRGAHHASGVRPERGCLSGHRDADRSSRDGKLSGDHHVRDARAPVRSPQTHRRPPGPSPRTQSPRGGSRVHSGSPAKTRRCCRIWSRRSVTTCRASSPMR